jgi:hypothetical protein
MDGLWGVLKETPFFKDSQAGTVGFLIYWTCSITWLVISQVLQNAPHFAVFYRNLFKN